MPSSELQPPLFFCGGCGLVLAQTEENEKPRCITPACEDAEMNPVYVHSWEQRY